MHEMCYNLKLSYFILYFVVYDFKTTYFSFRESFISNNSILVFLLSCLLLFPFPAETQQVRGHLSSAPLKIFFNLFDCGQDAISKVSDRTTIAIQLYRRLLLVEDAFPTVLLPESRSKTAMRDLCLSVGFEFPALRQIPGQ